MGLTRIILPQTRPSKLRSQPRVLLCSVATPAVDPINAFFTPERLAYYRDLHARYPLWCGDWPDDHRREPEYDEYWAGSQLIDETLIESTGGQEVFALDEGSNETLALVWSDEASETVAVVVRAQFVALQRAVGETFVDARTDPQTLGSFSRGLVTALESLFHPRGFPALQGWIPVGVPEPINGWYFRRLHRRLKSASIEGVDRTEILNEIRAYWENIGKTIGAIPRLPAGGSSCVLPNDFLNRIKNEGEDLVREIRKYNPSAEHSCDLASMFQTEKRSQHVKQTPTVLPNWTLRFRFPILSLAELESVTEKRGRVGTGVAEAVLGLMEGRLPLSASRIANRISETRVR